MAQLQPTTSRSTWVGVVGQVTEALRVAERKGSMAVTLKPVTATAQLANEEVV